jgi:hypothetical protein
MKIENDRPSKFDSRHRALAMRVCSLFSATEAQLAVILDVELSELQEYMKLDHEFRAVVKRACARARDNKTLNRDELSPKATKRIEQYIKRNGIPRNRFFF